MLSVKIFIFVYCFIYVNAKPMNNSVELMTDDAAYEISNIVDNVKFTDLHHNLGYVNISFKNIKVSEFNVESMKLVNTYEGYKVLLDVVIGKIESDFTAQLFSQKATAHVLGKILNFILANYDVTIKEIDGQIKAEIIKCNMVVEDYLLSVKAQGDTGLQSFLKNFAEKQYKGIATYLLQTNICASVKPEIQKILDERNLNEIYDEIKSTKPKVVHFFNPSTEKVKRDY